MIGYQSRQGQHLKHTKGFGQIRDGSNIAIPNRGLRDHTKVEGFKEGQGTSKMFRGRQTTPMIHDRKKDNGDEMISNKGEKGELEHG